MKPYYDEGGIVIYHGDALEILPHLEPVDLVLTDPPYGTDRWGRTPAAKMEINPSRSRLARARDYGGFGWDVAPTDEDLERVIAAGRKAIVFGGNFFALPPSPCWLVWDKRNGANDFADAELAWTNLEAAVRVFRHRWHGMLQEHGGRHKEGRYHPTQKPVALMRWAINLVDKADTILDPFMGSGTTLRAAKDLGRKAIGIEIEERYCEIAAERLRQQVFDLGDPC